MNIVALAGGVGGAKLADGLAQVLQPHRLTIIVNTADDFTHLCLKISPDLDTVCYTLAGLANPETGWGRVNETWNVLTRLKEMDMPDWFLLGDADLATHIARTSLLSSGWTLSQITQKFCEKWDILVKVLPMSDNVVQTIVYTSEGELGFQEYFVHRMCQPVVRGFKFNGVENSNPAPGVLDAINRSDGVIICPSNPWVSIDPILAVPGVRTAIQSHLTIAVSPIIGNKTIKGPAAKMFLELGIEPSAYAVAKHYEDFVDSLVIDIADVHLAQEIKDIGIRTFTTNIIMKDRVDRVNLAKSIIEYIRNWEA